MCVPHPCPGGEGHVLVVSFPRFWYEVTLKVTECYHVAEVCPAGHPPVL